MGKYMGQYTRRIVVWQKSIISKQGHLVIETIGKIYNPMTNPDYFLVSVGDKYYRIAKKQLLGLIDGSKRTASIYRRVGLDEKKEILKEMKQQQKDEKTKKRFETIRKKEAEKNAESDTD